MTNLDRHIRFPGTINLRDMGGYETEDGGRVKTGRLYRSGHLAHADDDALPEIAALNITLVCDFRIDDEREEHPNRYHDNHSPVVEILPVWPWKAPGADVAAHKMMAGEIGFDDAAGFQGSGYREFVREQADRFAKMFAAILADDHTAVLLHCSAGKDRTGIGTAMLHAALGVSRDDSVSDYMLSLDGQGARAQTMYYVEKEWADFDGPGDPVCTKDDIFTLFSVHPNKINAAFDEMETVGGSVDGYIRDVLGVSDDARAELKRRYVEYS